MKRVSQNIIKDISEHIEFMKRYNLFPLHNDGLMLTEALKSLENFDASDISGSVEKKIYSSEKSSRASNVVSEKVVNFDKQINEDFKNELTDNYEVKKITKEIFKTDIPDFNEISKLKDTISNCFKCRELSNLRNNVVFGSGNENADLVIVGEAPGADEDKQGLPFVGRAGKLLTDILKAINFSRDEVYICNILKCRPPENRNPMPDEIENCEPFLYNQLKLIKPKLILALGTFASQTLLRSKEPLGKLRGRFHTYEGVKMMVTYHPAALLRNPAWKKPTWEDVKMLRAEYDNMIKT